MDDRQQQLLDEAAGLLGMIAEVKIKALILKKKSGKAGQDELIDTMQAANKMKGDLATYFERLKHIGDELDEISGMAGNTRREEEPQAGLLG
jgi:uncharacterized protein YbbK (DUF523 family)